MTIKITRRRLLAGSAAALAMPRLSLAQGAKPRITAISQWSAGSDGAAISALGKLFEDRGGVWQHNPVPGFTTDMMNKLRAQIMAGDPPAISQLKGPEIAAWSKIAPTVDISPLVMERAKVSKAPTTWAEFNDTAEKMKAAGMIPLANGGNRPDDGQKFEIALAGISPEVYRRAIMQLDADALKGKEVLAAFEQLRKFSNYMNPNIAAQPWAVNLPAFVKGDMGMVLTGGWAQGNLFKAGATAADFSSGPAPQESGPPCFDLNADCFIFWKPKSADLDAGQKLFAEVVMEPLTQEMYSKITGSIPARTDVNLAAEGFTDGQRNSAQNLRDAIAKDRVVLSLGHNMAQPNGMTAAMIDVLTEYVHNSAIPAVEGQKRLVAAVAGAQ